MVLSRMSVFGPGKQSNEHSINSGFYVAMQLRWANFGRTHPYKHPLTFVSGDDRQR